MALKRKVEAISKLSKEDEKIPTNKKKVEEILTANKKDEEIPTTTKKVVSRDGTSMIACELSSKQKIFVKKFQGKVFVDIREVYIKDGQELPAKKGIMLPLDQWNILKLNSTRIQELIESFT